MKEEKLGLYDKIQGLRHLLKNNGVSNYEEELETLIAGYGRGRVSRKKTISFDDNSINSLKTC